MNHNSADQSQRRVSDSIIARRGFLSSMAVGGAAMMGNTASAERPSDRQTPKVQDALSSMKITRIRFYHAPSRTMFNQSAHVCTVETDAGLTGIGEGGSADTIRQSAGLLIGENPSRIEHLWQLMYRGYFYPPGTREDSRRRGTRSRVVGHQGQGARSSRAPTVGGIRARPRRVLFDRISRRGQPARGSPRMHGRGLSRISVRVRPVQAISSTRDNRCATRTRTALRSGREWGQRAIGRSTIIRDWTCPTRFDSRPSSKSLNLTSARISYAVRTLVYTSSCVL